MAGQILLVGAALAAAYAASKKSAPPATEPQTNKEFVDKGTDGGSTSTTASDGVDCGSTSLTPSGDTTGGSTSTTPSAGPAILPQVGAVLTSDASSSPSGPVPEVSASFVADPVSVVTAKRFNTLSGLTTKQLSATMATDGAAQGLVW